MISTSAIILFLLGATNVDASGIIETGRTVELNEVPYYVPPWSLGSIIPPAFGWDAASVRPATVITATNDIFGDDDLEATLVRYNETDDVWQSSFLDRMYPSPASSHIVAYLSMH